MNVMNRGAPTLSRPGSSYELRERPPMRPQQQGPVRFDLGREPPRISKEQRRLRERVTELQKKWESIRADLPPQLSRRHIGMISIGGVIGTGLFLGSADALVNGGPIGALLGYGIMGSVIYCLCVSIGEMIAFLPNVGGVVGLADIYVDRALGFSLGWAAWYHWSIILPVEIVAAAIVTQYWDVHKKIHVGVWTSIFLTAAVFINLFPSRIYGEMEFWFSTLKVTTIVVIILSCLIIDLGAAGEFHGLNAWEKPFASNYQGIEGHAGRLLGFWAVMMQAAFSFSGSEVPGIAAGEVINAAVNVPRALRRVWLRITLFYMGGIFAAGLLFHDAPKNKLDVPHGTGNSSPFVIIFRKANVKVLPDLVNAAILVSAWSAAASDVYISSRYLFFLARRGHAPKFLAMLIRFPRPTTTPESKPRDVDDMSTLLVQPTPVEPASVIRSPPSTIHQYTSNGHQFPRQNVLQSTSEEGRSEDAPRQPTPPEPPVKYVLPLASVLVSSSVGLLAFMTVRTGGPAEAFLWMAQVTSVASLQSWIGMLFTYLRFWQGTRFAEKREAGKSKEEQDRDGTFSAIERIKKHRHKGQPFLAIYALSMCVLVLVTSGWTVFLAPGWRIADDPTVTETIIKKSTLPARIPTFLSSYVPIPFFVLLTVGYKLVYQTKMVPLEGMTFKIDNIPEPEQMPKPRNFLERMWFTII